MVEKIIIAWEGIDSEDKVLKHLDLQVYLERILPFEDIYRVFPNAPRATSPNEEADQFYQTIDNQLSRPYDLVEVEVLDGENLFKKLSWLEDHYKLVHNLPSRISIDE